MILTGLDFCSFDSNLLLHGEQYLEVYKPLPTHGNIRSSIRISGLQDKVKAAVLELEVLSHNMDTGDVLCMNRRIFNFITTIFIFRAQVTIKFDSIVKV
jgi:hypothetical protein